jgi:CheY-like chemotaxis protein
MAEHRVVLLLEDDALTRALLVRLLTVEGYEVVTAADGREGLDRLAQMAPPDVILLDLMMPVMNGWEFRQVILKDPALAAIPVVVLTGDRAAPQASELLRVKDWLFKPVQAAELRAALRRHCPLDPAAP